MNEKLIRRMREIVGTDNVLSKPEDLAVYSYDGTFEEYRPDVVVLPQTTQQISKLIVLASDESLPVVTRGMASGLAAASVPFSGGIALSMTRMNQILEIDKLNSVAHVEAGIVTADLQSAVEKRDFFTLQIHPVSAIPPSVEISPAMRVVPGV